MIATAVSGASMSPLVPGLAPRGRLVVVGVAPDPLEVRTTELIFGTRTIAGSLTGSSIENEDNLRFAAAPDPIEVVPLSEGRRPTTGWPRPGALPDGPRHPGHDHTGASVMNVERWAAAPEILDRVEADVRRSQASG